VKASLLWSMIGRQAGSVEGGADDVCAELRGRHGRQGTEDAAEWCACCSNDDDGVEGHG
jgi:hypothetical protein